MLQVLFSAPGSQSGQGSRPEHQPEWVVIGGLSRPAPPTADDRLIRRLVRLAYNLRWSWEPRAALLFASLRPDVWHRSHNPVAVLRALSRDDDGQLPRFAQAIDDACLDLEQYLADGTNGSRARLARVAYLSPEFAIANCLPIYSGGLGVLAGDHLKASSDLGLPVVGVGLLYQFGYFRQCIDESGYQREWYERIDPTQLPVRPVVLDGGSSLRVSLPFPDRRVQARAWRADIGRVPLYLLDTNVDDNREDDRWISAHLYGGDQDTRIRQEMVLGIGGARLLRALNVGRLEPSVSVYHLNEGHSAFLVLELARERLANRLASSIDDALHQVAPSIAFTTHTPVSAGHDAFPSDLVEMYLGAYARDAGVSASAIQQLGRIHTHADDEPFSMTVLGLRGAARRNAVSALHGSISRTMWSGIGIGSSDRPPTVAMDAITNGVHAPTWVAPDMAALFDARLGHAWRLAGRDPGTWLPLDGVPRQEFWRARTTQRARLLALAGLHLDASRAMVIGFARRFATYKRAGLLLEDPDRLGRLIAGDATRPVVIVFAGKAHPRDEPGKELMQRVVEATRSAPLGGHLVFVEDYDLDLARVLVQGADVWLNTPRRPQEACGTSGMKAALNGALQVSELDGWWDEAYQPGIGWALGVGLPEDLPDDVRDSLEARELIDLLEQHVVPGFYQRDEYGLPSEWLERVVRSIIALAPRYSAERMVAEYASRVYWPAAIDGVGSD
jgi:glycogen phosphorylase